MDLTVISNPSPSENRSETILGGKTVVFAPEFYTKSNMCKKIVKSLTKIRNTLEIFLRIS